MEIASCYLEIESEGPEIPPRDPEIEYDGTAMGLFREVCHCLVGRSSWGQASDFGSEDWRDFLSILL